MGLLVWVIGERRHIFGTARSAGVCRTWASARGADPFGHTSGIRMARFESGAPSLLARVPARRLRFGECEKHVLDLRNRGIPRHPSGTHREFPSPLNPLSHQDRLERGLPDGAP